MLTKKGDLVKLAQKGEFDYIVHGCNCFCKMRSGLARQIATAFPEAVAADLETKPGKHFKLGRYTQAEHKLKEGLGWLSIINAYTQYDYGYDGKDRFQYQALRRVLLEFSIKLAVTQQKYNGPIRVGFPKIGAGLAGGNWTRILEELERFDRRTAKYCQTTLVLYE